MSNRLLKRLAPLGAMALVTTLRLNAAISDGMNAENILGQLDDSDNPVWTTQVPNYRPTDQGFNLPTDVVLDPVGHRLFVADYYNNRVLQFDLDSNNNLVDRTADHVLGQSTFTGFQNRTTQNGMFNPYGLAYDPTSQRLFVSEYSNHRVLVFNVSSISDGQNADYVLGQTNFTSGSAITSQTRMNSPTLLKYDGLNDRLYVPERSNNRVLVFDVGSITNGENAIFVLGQPNFTSNTSNTTQSGLSAPYGVEFSTSTQTLYVSEYNNNRVMVYDASSLANGMNASYVIGQPTFTSNTSATTQNGLKNPYGLALDPGSNRLFVSEYNNSRVLVFDVTTHTNNPNAINVLGQANYTSGTSATSKSRLYIPRGLAFDLGNNRLYVADGNNHRVVHHDVSSIVNGQNAAGGLGLQDGSGTDSWNQYLMNAPPNNKGFVLPYGVLVDTSTHRLFVSDGRNSRVLVFNLDANDNLVDRTADYVLGQSDFNNAVPAAAQNRLNYPIGLAFDPIGKRLFVGEVNNGRILIFDLSGGLTNGQNASFVIGQTDFSTTAGGSGQNKLYAVRGLTYDPLNNRLYVADLANNRVLVFDVSTVTNGMNASYVLGQPDFTTTTAGTTQNKMSSPYDVGLNISDQRLFVADASNKRVMVFDVSTLNNGQNATHVLGQADFTSNGASTTQNGMNTPYGVAHDPVSGRLYVSDGANHRILTFDATTLANGQNAVNVLGQPNFTSGSAGVAQGRLNTPIFMYIDPAHHRLFTADHFNHRVVTYLVDLAPSTSTLTALPGTNSGVVSLTWPSAGDEESRGTLSGNYRIQYATYTATWDTSSTPQNAYTLTIATTGVTPEVVQSTAVAGLMGGVTYSFALFTQDDQGNWSGVSNTTTSKPLDLVAPSTSTLDAHAGAAAGDMTLTWTSAGHDGGVGSLTGTYRIQYATFPAAWNSSTTLDDVTTVTLATAAVTPGSLRSHTLTGLTTETAWSFALFTQDDEGNWSGVSNTANAVTTGDVTPPSAVGDLSASANLSPGSVHLTWSAPGNDGASGNLIGSYRVQYATFTASWSTTTTPTNAWTTDWLALATPGSAQSIDVNGLVGNARYFFVLWTKDVAGNWSPLSNGANAVTADWPDTGNGMTLVDVAGPGNGLTNGAVVWGDMDNNGSADLVVLGEDSGGTPQLRVYWYFGAGAFSPTPTEVAGTGNGLKNGVLALGDYNNDGYLDILAEGQDSSGNRQLRVFKNNVNGTFAAPIDVAGLNNGLSNGGVAWGDDDNDGDLDVLASGTDGSNNQLRVYRNNGNGTFNNTPLDIAGVNGGLRDGGVAWADFDGDGDVDVLLSGFDGTNSQLRVYRNNGDGTYNPTPLNVAGLNGGLRYGGVAWGDMDNDGRVDVLTNGSDGTSHQLRAYKNNGEGSFGSAVDVAGPNVGTSSGTVTWGDFNNDGNMDALTWSRGWVGQGLVGYWKFNEGSGTSAADSSGNGSTGTLLNSPTWAPGVSGNGLMFDGVDDYVEIPSSPIYSTNYGGVNQSFSYSAWIQSSNYTPPQVILSRRNHCNSEGHFKIYVSGNKVYLSFYSDIDALTRVLVSQNNVLTNGQLHHIVWTRTWGEATTKLYVDGTSVPLAQDYPNNGTRYEDLVLSIGAQKGDGVACVTTPSYFFTGLIDDVRIYNRILSTSEVARAYATTQPGIYIGNETGTFNTSPVEVDPTNGGLSNGSLAMADVDGDGDLDLAVSGTDGTSPHLRVYLSTQSLTQPNMPPSAPTTFSASFTFSTTTVSVASFTWNAASDNGAGATPAAALNYDIQVSTTLGFTHAFFTGALGATPRMGSFLKPPTIFPSGFHGVMLKSTHPWTAQSSASFGLRTDTTYYYRVKSIDAGLTESPWSSAQTLFTGVAPQSVADLGLSAWVSPGVTDVSWTAPGDDTNQLPLTGTYQIQYATYPAIWNPSTLPANAYSVSLSTVGVSPGTSETFRMTGLATGAPWYFTLFTQDDAGNWSEVSNSTSAVATAPPSPPATGSFTARTETGITADWDFSLGTSSYTFVLSTATDNPPLAVAGSSSTAAPFATITALIPNTTYFGFTQACNQVGCSAYTAFGSTLTWANPPLTLSTSALTSVSATLTWDANSNPAGTTFEVETATTTGGPYALAVSTTNVTASIDTLTPGTIACFRILARSWDGVPTVPTPEVCVVPPFSNPSPGSFSAPGVSSVLGAWSSAPGATSYTFRVSTAPDNPPISVSGSSTTTNLTATVDTLSPNTTYFGFVKGCIGIDCSDDTALGWAVTEANPATGLSTTTVSSLAATLTWGANSNPAGTLFNLERSTAMGGTYSLDRSTTSLSADVSSLTPGETACFRVTAQNHATVDAASTMELCIVPPFSTPGATSFTTAGSGTVIGAWTAAPGATSYTLRLSTSSDNPPTSVSGSSSTTTLTASVSGLTANTTYFGFVKGCNGIDCSDDTSLGWAVTHAVAPINLSTATITAVSMTLSFDVNGNPAGTSFEIELATDGVTFSPALTTTSPTPTLSGLTPALTYSVRVRAVNHNSVPSAYSPTISVPTSGTLPATPVNLLGSAGSGGITYAWNPVSTNALGDPLPFGVEVRYEFSQSNTPTGTFTALALSTATTYGPVPAAGVEHFYRVRTEAETLYSLPTTVIDNVGAGRYVFPSVVGTAVTTPQGMLTGVDNPRHVISLTDQPTTDGALVAVDIAVLDGTTGTPATNVTFSPSGELTVPLPNVTNGERSVEYFNGSAWVLAGTAHINAPNMAQFSFGRTGGYRLMGLKSGDVVRSVIARVFTPNGDGRNDVTVIRLENPNGDPTHGTIYDADGVRVADMATGPAPGLSLMWDGRDANGATIPGGVYIYQVTVGTRRATGTIVVAK